MAGQSGGRGGPEKEIDDTVVYLSQISSLEYQPLASK